MTTFSDLSLDPRVLQAVTESGYTTPTPIQIQAIPSALEGRDVLGIAQTGTGKTAAFVLPMIHHLSKGRARARMPRSLVLCPTRELAAQVSESFEKYAHNVKLTMALLIGGVSFKDQDKLIDRGVDVLIATPGRLLDHFERGKLMLTGVNIMVVDEADRMLDMGFIPDIERIFKLVPFTKQTLFFSATMAPEITRITQEFLHNPVRVEVARQATTSETIQQAVVKHTPRRKDTGAAEKREILRRLIRSEGEAITNGIIFCNRKVDVDVVAKSLKKHGFDAAALHGDLDQKLRMKILGQFRDGELKLLIASDVAARGLDIPNVSHVFNFDVPIHSEDYVHRIGRTGRAGRSGTSITLCLPHEQKNLDKIEELVKKPIPVMESPLGGASAPEPEAAPSEERGERRGRGERGGSARRDGERRDADRRDDERRDAAKNDAERHDAAKREGERRDDRRERDRDRRPRGETPTRPVPPSEAVEAERAPRGEGRRSRRDDGPRVIGMGDHVPAFLLRSFVLDAEPVAQAEPELPEPQAEPELPLAVEPQAEPQTLTPPETPVEEGPAMDVPATEVPAMELPVMEASGIEASGMDASGMEASGMEASAPAPEAPVEAAEGKAPAKPVKEKKPRAPRKRAIKPKKASGADAPAADVDADADAAPAAGTEAAPASPEVAGPTESRAEAEPTGAPAPAEAAPAPLDLAPARFPTDAAPDAGPDEKSADPDAPSRDDSGAASAA